jgi:hypothetical protein
MITTARAKITPPGSMLIARVWRHPPDCRLNAPTFRIRSGTSAYNAVMPLDVGVVLAFILVTIVLDRWRESNRP